MAEKLRKSGIDIIGDVPWGTHFCQFYQTKEDLMDRLIPYFKAGLENNELCVWITAQPLEVEEAKEALRKAVPEIDAYLENGQMEIIPYTHGYVKEGVFDPEKVVDSWVEKIDQALARGYDGLRATGDTRWLEKKGWDDFVDYEKKVDTLIGKHQVIALCPYSLDMCSEIEIIDVVSNHQFALIKRKGKWERIENFGRKRAEEALQESKERFRTVFTKAAAGLAIVSPEISYHEVNERFCEITGYSREELLSKDCPQLVHPDDQEENAAEVKRLLDGETTSFVKDLRLIGADGRIVWIRVNVSPLHDYEQGKDGQSRLISVVEDITERKKVEEILKKVHKSLEEKVKARTAELEEAYKALMENEKRFSEAQKMAHIGNWDWNLVTDEMHWSDETYRIFGFIPREFGSSYNVILSHTHPDDRDYVDNAVKRALNGKPFSIDHRIISADGENRVVYAQGEVVFDKKNSPIRMRGTVQDITERKKAEEKIQTLLNAVESSNDAIVTESLEGNITSWNKSAEQIYGYLAEEILGKNVSILEPDNIKGEIKQLIEKIKQGKRICHYETLRLKKDGILINISITLSPIFDASGKLVAISAITRDITERKQAEKALRESEARLRRFYESSLIGVFYYYLDGSITDANDKFLEIVGHTREDLQAGRVNWKKMTPPEYRFLDGHAIKELKVTGVNTPYEKEYTRKNGSRVPIIVGTATFDQARDEGIAFVLDITDKKKQNKPWQKQRKPEKKKSIIESRTICR